MIRFRYIVYSYVGTGSGICQRRGLCFMVQQHSGSGNVVFADKRCE